MAKRRRRGIELFEVLSDRKQRPTASLDEKGPASESEPLSAAKPDHPKPMPPARPRTGQEIIFSVESAFVIFVAVLILLGSAYKLGQEVGLREARQTLAPTGDPVPERENVKILPLKPNGRIGEALDIPGDAYTLKVFDSKKGLDLLLLDRAYLLRQPSVMKQAIAEAYIYKSESEEVHSLGLGLFRVSNDPRLVKLMQEVKKLDGPPTREKKPYSACAIYQTQQLGIAVH